MVHEQVNNNQQDDLPAPDDAAMSSSWNRVSKLLDERGKSLKWLADQLGYTVQRVSNWKQRGQIPANEHAAVSAVIQKSVDWINGLSIEDEPARELSVMGRTLGQEFDTISDPQKAVQAFAQIIAIIERARAI